MLGAFLGAVFLLYRFRRHFDSEFTKLYNQLTIQHADLRQEFRHDMAQMRNELNNSVTSLNVRIDNLVRGNFPPQETTNERRDEE